MGPEKERPEPTMARAFRQAVESTGHAIYWTDTTGTIEYVNPAFESQTGYTAEEAIGNNANILQSGLHDDHFYERLWDTILAGETWEGEITNQRKTGQQYVVRQTISPIEDETGELVRFVAVNEEITDLRAYQRRLERERDRFAALLDAVPVSLVLVAFEGADPIVKHVNSRFEETFGFSESVVVGSSLDTLILDETDADQAREINGRLQRNDSVNREVTRRTADGEQRTFLLNASPMQGDDAEVLATYIDITDRKETEEKLRQKTAELEDFANVVSHDLRNPLNLAMGHVELLAADAATEHRPTDDVTTEHLETIRTAHERMQELIENILMLARQGKTIDDVEAVSLAACASRSWETIETAAATLSTETSQTVRADEHRLRQLFGNLIRNAIEHGGDDVTITVGSLEDGFFVEDDGPGIPPSERTGIFEPGHTTTETGTGLGLWIVRDIVDAHGWQIDVTDGADGGARFEITGVECLC
ncbi:PAS domain S-box protein [Halobacteria archaeon AArc-dxtr1]|nr:PAS domain S-box protein [Halobacteria archaeon AArc-dxtr1]